MDIINEKRIMKKKMEPRRSSRKEMDLPVNFIAFDESDNETGSGVGRAINMSEHGILLMTPKPFQNVHVLLMTMNIDGKDVRLKGRLVSSNIHFIPGYCFSGIEFIGKIDEQVTIAKEAEPGDSSKEELRRHSRIENSMLLKYHLFDNRGKPIGYGKGRTVNLSQSGILLESNEPLEGIFVILITLNIGVEVKLKGRLVHSTLQQDSGNYLSGIEFVGEKEKQVESIVEFIKAYYRNKSGIYWIDVKK